MVNIEAIDLAFLEKHFGAYTGDLFKSEPQLKEEIPEGCNRAKFAALQAERNLQCLKANFNGEQDANWGALADLTRSLEAGDFQKALDVDATLWMLAFNNVLVNLDSYTGNFSDNYYLYQDENNRFYPHSWEIEFCFWQL